MGRKFYIKAISIDAPLLEETESIVEMYQSDFSKYTRNALKEKNAKVIQHLRDTPNE